MCQIQRGAFGADFMSEEDGVVSEVYDRKMVEVGPSSANH